MKMMLIDHWKQTALVVLIVCFLAALGLAAPAAHAQDPGVSYNPFLVQGIVSPAPLLPVEFNGTGVVSFDVGNTGSTELDLRPGQAMRLTITLSKGVPNVADPNDPIAALAALGGDGVEWFDWSYNPDIATFEAVQRMTIPGESRRTVTVQYRVTENSYLGASPTASNGFNANLTPPPYANPQPTDDDTISSYTFVRAFDYGDAPDSYGAAWHEINVTKRTDGRYLLYARMGQYVDPEAAMQYSADARGDDLNQSGGLGVDDEDGVTFPIMSAGDTATIQTQVTFPSTSMSRGFLHAWIDWDRNGIFDEYERITDPDDPFAYSRNSTGPINIEVTVPSNAVDGYYFARFRFGPEEGDDGLLGPTGGSLWGEVEDYRIYVGNPLGVLLSSFFADTDADHVLVAWQTTSEVNNTGFNLYRALEAGGERTLLGWFPSTSPGSTQGSAYSYQDFDVIPGQTYWYWLEDISLSGATTLHGPVSTTFQAPSSVALSALEADSHTGSLVLPWLLAALLAVGAAVVALRRCSASA